jgi:NAD-dependent deacetylase
MFKPKLVVLTGAGISAESGLRTFRDSDGLWEGYNIDDVATPRAWQKDPKLVLDFYNMRRKDILAAQPNAAHLGLAALEEKYDVHIITQNIDDLHERAGSTNVIHLHGEILKMRAENHPHDERHALSIVGDILPGDMNDKGSQLRPHIVWFEEPVPNIELAIPIMEAANVFVLIGTSLAVYPAAGLVDYVHPDVKKYIIDKKMPPVKHYRNVVNIELPATEGIVKLMSLLR